MRGKIIGLFVLVILVININICCFAQIMLSRTKVERKIMPGETIEEVITVENRSGKEIMVKVYPYDFTYVAPFDGRRRPIPAGENPYSCADWLEPSPAFFPLGPHQKKTVCCLIKVPERVEGGYYGVLFFEEVPPELRARIGVSVRVRVACLFFLEAPDKRVEAKVEEISASGNEIKGYLSNTGNVQIISQSDFFIMDKEGKIVERGKVGQGKFYLLPQQRAPFSLVIPVNVPQGEYTAVINFDLGEGMTVKEVDFVKEKTGIRILQVKD